MNNTAIGEGSRRTMYGEQSQDQSSNQEGAHPDSGTEGQQNRNAEQ